MISVVASTDPIVLAHRGGASEGTENSLELFRRTVASGIRHIETDVHLSADNQIVVSHDSSLERCFGAEGHISDFEYSELSAFKNAAGESPPLLSTVLKEFPNVFFNVDVKTDEVAAHLGDLITETETQDRVLVASFSERRLERLRRDYPGLHTSLGVNGVVRLLLASETVSRADSWHVPGPRQGVVAVQVPEKSRGIRVISPRFVATAHTAGLAVHAWTVNDVDQVEQLLDWGVDGIITDRPTMVKELLVERGQWGPQAHQTLVE